MVESGVTPPKARATARVAPTISGGLIGAFVYGRGIPLRVPWLRIALLLSFANRVFYLETDLPGLPTDMSYFYYCSYIILHFNVLLYVRTKQT